LDKFKNKLVYLIYVVYKMEISRKHCYVECSKDFSNISIGLLLRALNKCNIAYVDFTGSSKNLINFFENLFLNYSFSKNFNKKLDIFKFKKSKFEKLYLPNVEYQLIAKENLINELKNYDLIFLDNIDFNVISKNNLKLLFDILKDKEVVLRLNNKKDFDSLNIDFDLISEVIFKNNRSLVSNDNIVNIYGNGKGKTTFCLGLVLRKLMEGKKVRWIGFDKGGDYYSEVFFFNLLKKYSYKHRLKIDFDYIYTGKPRFIRNNEGNSIFRFRNLEEDYAEAREGLSLLRTAIRKDFYVFADELNSTLLTKLLNIKEVLESLKNCNSKLYITGRINPNDRSNLEIIKISKKVLEVKEIKHYFNSENKGKRNVKGGIDY